MDAARRRARLAAVALAVAAAVAGGAGLGGAGASAATGQDISPWTTSHGRGVRATDAEAGNVAVQPFVLTKKADVSSPILF